MASALASAAAGPPTGPGGADRRRGAAVLPRGGRPRAPPHGLGVSPRGVGGAPGVPGGGRAGGGGGPPPAAAGGFPPPAATAAGWRRRTPPLGELEIPL